MKRPPGEPTPEQEEQRGSQRAEHKKGELVRMLYEDRCIGILHQKRSDGFRGAIVVRIAGSDGYPTCEVQCSVSITQIKCHQHACDHTRHKSQKNRACELSPAFHLHTLSHPSGLAESG